MTAPTFQAPAPADEPLPLGEEFEVEDAPDDDRCGSLKETVLHRDGGHTVYLRCEATAGHPGRNHRSWMRKWKTEEEDGRLS